MDAFAIVRLLGACIAMILGAIVFMVLFFRGMSWIDRWIKMRHETDLSRPRRNRNKSLRDQSFLDRESRLRKRPSNAEGDPNNAMQNPSVALRQFIC